MLHSRKDGTHRNSVVSELTHQIAALNDVRDDGGDQEDVPNRAVWTSIEDHCHVGGDPSALGRLIEDKHRVRLSQLAHAVLRVDVDGCG